VVVEDATVKNTLAATNVTRAVARLATGYLEAAAAACARLVDPADSEALHDFRVAMRRLRSLLWAYSPWLGDSLPRKLRQKLRKLVARSGPARDAEVQLAWLREQWHKAGDAERPGVQWLVEYLATRRDREYLELREALPAAFPRLRRRLLARLDRAADAYAESFGAATAQRLQESASDFQAHMEQVHGAADEEEIHHARIAGKRLRYLLEPLAGELAGGKALVMELRALQDLMGEIHDHQVLSTELLKAAEQAGAARLRARMELSLRGVMVDAGLQSAQAGDEAAGLLRIACLLHHARQARLAQLQERLDAGNVGRFLDHLHGACKRLREAAASPKP
jgi:CHAD domain-containing protein